MHIHTDKHNMHMHTYTHRNTQQCIHRGKHRHTETHTVCNNSFNKGGLQWVVCTYIVNIKLNNKIITVSSDGMD